jgi:hypothetical protein
MMDIPLYFIEDVWCILEVYIRNNCYWIDWNVIYDNNNKEINEKCKITLEFTSNQNIVCIKDNNFCLYNNVDKQIHYFNDYYNVISIDGSHSIDTLSDLKNKYEEFLYKIDDC